MVKHIIFDPIISLEVMAEELALKMYILSPFSKNYKDANILEFSRTAGYYFLKKLL